VSRRTPSRARSGNAAEVNRGISDVTVASPDPKLPIATEFVPPVAAAELPSVDVEHQPRRRTMK